MHQETASEMVPGVKTPKTRFSTPPHTGVKSFPSSSGHHAPPTEYPKGSQLILPPPPPARIDSVDGKGSDSISNESMPAIYPRPQDSVNNPLDHTNEEVQPKRDGDIFNLEEDEEDVFKDGHSKASQGGVAGGSGNKGDGSSGEGVANNGDENKVPQEDGNEEERMESSITEEDEDKMSLKMDTSKRRKKLDACTIDPSINGNGDGDELIPLLDTANQRHQHCTIWKTMLFIVLTIIIGTLCLPVPPTLYELTKIYASIGPPQSTLAVQGDYVSIPHAAIHRGIMLQYTLHFSVEGLTSGYTTPLPSVDVYCVEPNQLTSVIKKVNFLTQDLSFTNKIYYFKNCTIYPGKCILGQFIYQAMTNLSLLAYDIILNNFTAGQTHIDAIVFDSYKEFFNFRSDSDFKAVKDIQINQRSFYFELPEVTMAKSSYYFFVVAEVVRSNTSNWFTVQPSGLHVYYNASSQPVCCTMNTTNDFSCSFNGIRDDSVTYLARVHGDKVRGIPTEYQLYNITSSVSDPLPTNIGHVIAWVCFVVVVAVLVAAVFVIFKVHLVLQRKLRPTVV